MQQTTMLPLRFGAPTVAFMDSALKQAVGMNTAPTAPDGPTVLEWPLFKMQASTKEISQEKTEWCRTVLDECQWIGSLKPYEPKLLLKLPEIQVSSVVWWPWITPYIIYLYKLPLLGSDNCLAPVHSHCTLSEEKWLLQCSTCEIFFFPLSPLNVTDYLPIRSLFPGSW